MPSTPGLPLLALTRANACLQFSRSQTSSINRSPMAGLSALRFAASDSVPSPAALDGKKRVLASLFRFGRENLEEWKNVLRSLIERGRRRVLLVVHDDFSGLLPITRSLFPQADIQLCIVHLQRNAKSHLSKTDAPEFNQRLRALKTAWSPEVAAAQFEDLSQRFESRSSVFIRE